MNKYLLIVQAYIPTRLYYLCEYQVPYVALTDVADIYIAKMYLLSVRVLDSTRWLPVRIPTKDAPCWPSILAGGARFESQLRTPPSATNGPGFEPHP